MANSKLAAKTKGARRPPESDLGFTWGPRNSLVFGLGLAVLVAGYVALSRGSTTLAPLLLVSGYCGLIPASLLWRGRREESGE